MNEDTSIISITYPNGDRAVAKEMHALVVSRTRELRAEFEAIAAKLTPESYTETKADWTRLKKIDGELKAIIERVEAASFGYAATDALLTQLRETRALLKGDYADGWSKFVELRDAGKPEPERFEYLAEFRMPQEAFAKLAAKWEKDGLEFRARRVKDGESAKVAKLFEEKEV